VGACHLKANWLPCVNLLLLVLQTGTVSSDSLARGFVEEHNTYRSRVGSPPLVWSDKLAEGAEAWAANLLASGRFAPRREGHLGQNLFLISGGKATPASVVAAWMSEEKNYNYRTNTCKARCGHYTQIIWQATKRVGCGVARNREREVWVCDYDPPGNIVGERPY